MIVALTNHSNIYIIIFIISNMHTHHDALEKFFCINTAQNLYYLFIHKYIQSHASSDIIHMSKKCFSF